MHGHGKAQATASATVDVVQELVADEGYHSNQLLEDLTALGVRTYIHHGLLADCFVHLLDWLTHCFPI